MYALGPTTLLWIRLLSRKGTPISSSQVFAFCSVTTILVRLNLRNPMVFDHLLPTQMCLGALHDHSIQTEGRGSAVNLRPSTLNQQPNQLHPQFQHSRPQPDIPGQPTTMAPRHQHPRLLSNSCFEFILHSMFRLNDLKN